MIKAYLPIPFSSKLLVRSLIANKNEFASNSTSIPSWQIYHQLLLIISLYMRISKLHTLDNLNNWRQTSYTDEKGILNIFINKDNVRNPWRQFYQLNFYYDWICNWRRTSREKQLIVRQSTKKKLVSISVFVVTKTV